MKQLENLEGKLLEAFMSYVPEEGIAFERFVEHGAWLLGPKDASDLRETVAQVRSKTNGLNNPRLARQLGFLADLFECTYAQAPEGTRAEVAFALVYMAAPRDLVPDHMQAGHVDDAAVVEAVLSRHAAFFEKHCTNYGREWCTIKPSDTHPHPLGKHSSEH